MTAKIYSFRLEKVRRKLAELYQAPLKRVRIVENRTAFHIILERDFTIYGSGFITVVIDDHDNLLEFDGLLSLEEIDVVISDLDFQPDEYGYGNLNDELLDLDTPYDMETFEAIKAIMKKDKHPISNVPDTTQTKLLEWLFNKRNNDEE